MDNIRITSGLLEQVTKYLEDPDKEPLADAPAIVSTGINLGPRGGVGVAGFIGNDVVVVPLSFALRLDLQILSMPHPEILRMRTAVRNMLYAVTVSLARNSQRLVRAELRQEVPNDPQPEPQLSLAKDSDLLPRNGRFEYEPRSVYVPPPDGRDLGWIPWHQRSATILEFARLGLLLRKQARQRTNPPKLGSVANPAFAFLKLEPLLKDVIKKVEGIQWPDRAELTFQTAKDGTRGRWIKSPHMNGFKMEMSSLSERCYILLGSTGAAKELTERFDHFCLPTTEQGDSTRSWFPELALALSNLEVRINVKRTNRNTKLDYETFTVSKGVSNHGHKHEGWHAHAGVNALTAAALAMKAHGDIEELVNVFSYAPNRVAADMRRYQMGASFGTVALRNLLASMFEKIAENPVRQDSNLLQATVDVLVSYLARHDTRHFVVSDDNQEKQSAWKKIAAVLELSPRLAAARQDMEKYLNLAAIRDGLAYAALYAYARDLDKHNQDHVDVLKAGLQIVVEVASGAAGAASGGAAVVIGPLAKSGLSAIASLIVHGATHGYEAKMLEKAIDTRLEEAILSPARNKNVVPWCNKEVANEYKQAVQAYAKTVEAIAKRNDTSASQG